MAFFQFHNGLLPKQKENRFGFSLIWGILNILSASYSTGIHSVNIYWLNWFLIPTMCFATSVTLDLPAPSFFFFFFPLPFLGPRLRHIEFSTLGVLLDLQLQACTSATVIRDPSRVCNLYHSSQQCQILTLSKARSWTQVLMDTSRICYH